LQGVSILADADNQIAGQSLPDGVDQLGYVNISPESKRRYLNYALSVIQARALPDVRDGLKPVQRRILFVMFDRLGLTADSKHRKCSKIVGDTTGSFHPHGDSSVYDALCRMAQDFSLRYHLVDGQGNFGSIMGLPAAAMRYPEARLRAIAEDLMNELRYETVDMRPTYDATDSEPTVLPARFPNLIVNGTSGIAVGMATNIPPHNLSESIKACLFLIENRDQDVKVAQLTKFIKGPDFPLGGRIVTDRKSLQDVYETGRGSIKVRGEWKFDVEKKKELKERLVVYSIPYGVETGPLMQEIGDVVASRKLPQLIDCSEQSDDRGIRIVLDIKPGADPDAVMAYLYKHTPLEQNFAYNSTCLVPDVHGALIPARLSLLEMLKHFLDFRLKTIRRRFEYQLRQLERRIHILEGFEIIFNGLDKALKLIRQSTGKADAATRLMAAFPLDAEQTDAILDLALYRISSLEIDKIVKELKEKRAEAAKIRSILASEKKLWDFVKTELEELDQKFGDKRRTIIGSAEEIVEFNAAAYIVKENTNVVLTRDGWIKRVGRLASVEGTRVREGDEVQNVLPASTLDNIVYFASDGVAYTQPIEQIQVTAGYGEPLSKFYRLGDGVNVVGSLTTDPRFTPAETAAEGESGPGPYLLIATLHGQVMRLPLGPLRTPSTKAGRKFCRLEEGDKVVEVQLISDATSVFIASQQARILHFSMSEIPILSGAGKGVRGMKLEAGDRILGIAQMTRPSDCLRVMTTADKELTFGQLKYSLTARGGKGIKTSHRSDFASLQRPPIELVDWAKMEEE
jgi:DNA gyrase subunit A